MRTALTSILTLLVLAAGVVPPFGAPPALAKNAPACCKASEGKAGCNRASNPMPCCEIRPAPESPDALPSPSVRTAPPARAHLHLPVQAPSPAASPAGLAFIHPHDLAAFSAPPRLYRLHSAYLI